MKKIFAMLLMGCLVLCGCSSHKTDQAAYEAYVKQGEQLYEDHQYSEAADAFLSANEEDPNALYPYKMLYKIYTLTGQSQKRDVVADNAPDEMQEYLEELEIQAYMESEMIASNTASIQSSSAFNTDSSDYADDDRYKDDWTYSSIFTKPGTIQKILSTETGLYCMKESNSEENNQTVYVLPAFWGTQASAAGIEEKRQSAPRIAWSLIFSMTGQNLSIDILASQLGTNNQTGTYLYNIVSVVNSYLEQAGLDVRYNYEIYDDRQQADLILLDRRIQQDIQRGVPVMVLLEQRLFNPAAQSTGFYPLTGYIQGSQTYYIVYDYADNTQKVIAEESLFQNMDTAAGFAYAW